MILTNCVHTLQGVGAVDTAIVSNLDQQDSVFWYGANLEIVGKTNPHKLSHPGAWVKRRGTFADLADHHSKGHPWMPALLDGNRKRWQTNANYAEVLAIDVDNSGKNEDGKEIYVERLTIAQAIVHPFIAQHCGLGIESSSSKTEHNKARFVFRLPRPVTSWKELRTCNRYLMTLVGEQVADGSCKDASRYFFGGQGRSPFILRNDAVLPESFIEDAIAWDAEQLRQHEIAHQQALERRRQYPPESEDDELRRVEEALAYAPQRFPNCGNYGECFAIAAALVNAFGEATAIALLERFIPPHAASNDRWNPEKVVRGLSRGQAARPATLGSVFYYCKREGWKPSQRVQSMATGGDRPSSLKEKSGFLASFIEKKRLRSGLSGIGFAPLPIVPDTDVVIVDSHQQGYQLGMAAGAKLVGNLSAPATGKSTLNSQTTPEFFGAERVVTVLQDVLNPSVPELLKHARVDGRHHGTVIKDGKLRRATAETPELAKLEPGNCGFVTAIAQLNAQNPVNSAYTLACQGCKNTKWCGQESGTDYGARHQAAQALKQPRIVMSYGRLRGDGEESSLLQGAVLILDESSSNVQFTKELPITPRDIRDKASQIAFSGNEALLRLLPFLKVLSGDDWRNIPGADKRFGVDQAECGGYLKDLVPEIPWAAIAELEDEAAELKHFGLENPDRLSDQEMRRLKALQEKRYFSPDEMASMNHLETKSNRTRDEYLRLRVYRKYELTAAEEKERDELEARSKNSRRAALSPGEMLALAKELPKRWLTLFFQVLAGDITGHIHWDANGITLTLPEDKHLTAVHQSKMTILSDASESRSKRAIAQKYQVQEDQVFLFQVRPKHGGKVETINITGLGTLSKNRGEGLEECRKAVVAQLKKNDPTHKTFDWKGFGADGVLFRDNIGSNDYQNCKSISTTMPRPNLGALLAKYCVMNRVIVSKTDPDFQRYYQEQIREQLVQTRGRLREAIRPGQKLTFYILGDGEIPIEGDRTIPAYEITPDAARKGDRTFLQIVEAAKWVVQQGQALTQSALARATALQGLKDGKGYSQQYISKIWARILDALQLFLYNHHKKSCSSPPPDQEKVAALIPVVEEIAASGDLPGLDEFLEWLNPPEISLLLQNLNPFTQSAMLRVMLSFLPPALLLEVTA